jgi:glucose/arabinose dehydrogenase
MIHKDLTRISGLLQKSVFTLFLVASACYLNAQTFPSNFAGVQLATGLDPVGMDLAPDGRIFLTEKNGKVRIVKNGSLLANPFVTISVDNSNERGLLGIVLDPDFANNRYVYVYYTVPGNNVHNRVSRFTANGDIAVSNSELILLELDALSSAGNHNAGALFFKDGKLFITTGENASPSKAQSMTTLLGKVLRINSDGSIPSDNPFYTTATGNYRAIYALGFRNPFKAAVQPGTGKVYVNDVGGGSYEEVNELVAGKNYGWPTIEGFKTNETPPANYQDPVYAYGRSNGCSITGGAFYNPTTTQFPASYTGKYFFADYCNGYIKTIDPANNYAVGSFATGLDRPLDIKIGTDGTLYFIARGGIGGGSVDDNTSSNEGVLWKVSYTASGAPVIAVQPANKTATVGGSATFSVTASGTPTPTYQWQRNGQNISGATAASYTLTNVTTADNGAKFKVVISNSVSSVTSNEATLTVNTNQPPVASIAAPTNDSFYSAGETISYSGTGTDPEDGALAGNAFSWKILLHHNDDNPHTHTALDPTSGSTSGTYVIPVDNETSPNVFYRIYLTVTDAGGLSHTDSVTIKPRKVTITLATNPAGLKVKLDGNEKNTPHVFTGVVGINRTIEAVSPQTAGGNTYTFDSWSDGGNAEHTIPTPTSNTTYTANYLLNPENPSGTANGLDYFYYEVDFSGNATVLPDFATLTAVKTGTVTSFDLSMRNRDDKFAFKYTGYVNIATDGQYTFYTSSDDGSKLYIGNNLVVNNDGLHGNREESGTIGLKAGKHPITVTFFEQTGDQVLTVSYLGPGITKQAIPASALYRIASLTNIALNQPSNASGSCQSGEGPAKAVNGSVSGGLTDKWCHNAAGDKWLKLTLDKNYSISRWVVKHAGAGGEASRLNTRDFKLQKSLDGSIWVDVDSVQGNTANITDRLTTRFTTQHVRLLITNSGADNAARIYELELYGTGAETGGSRMDYASQEAGNLPDPLRVYPVPASHTLYVEFVSPRAQEVKIQLVNLQSQEVMSTSRTAAEGKNVFMLDVTPHKSALYFMNVFSKDNKYSKKVIIGEQ